MHIKLREKLIEPHPLIERGLPQQRARIMASLTLGLLIVTFLLFVRGVMTGGAGFQIYAFGVVVAISYWLSRTRWAAIAAFILIISVSILNFVFFAFAQVENFERIPQAIAFVTLPVLLATLLLPASVTLFVTIFNLLGLTVMHLYWHWVQEQTILPIIITVTISVIGVIFAYLREDDVITLLDQQKELNEINRTLEDRVERRTEELAVANNDLQTFAYTVSHDLRAPVRAIRGFGKILQDDFSDALDGEGQDFLNRILQSGKLMDHLIEDMLWLSRAGRIKLSKSDMDLSQIVETILDNFQRLEPDRKVCCKIAPDISAKCDAGLIRVVLDNLISNAWKFSSHQPESVIEFGRAKGQPDGTYFIRDNGVGFDMAYSEKLFSPFERLHSTEEFEGTGIGLATVNRIISRHGGKIWAESTVGEGATFYFSIPES